MASKILGLIHKYTNRIEQLEKEINSLERVSDKLILASEAAALQKVIEDLKELKNVRTN